MPKISPVKDFILVELLANEEKTESGFIIKTERLKNIGTVKAIGDAVEDVKVGQVVCFQPLSYEKIKESGKIHYIIKEENVMAYYE